MPRAVVVLTMLVILLGASSARADECHDEEIRIEFDGNVYGGEGDVVQVALVAVDPHLIGATCTGTATVENNSSAHLGNDFIISSGGTSVEIPDFERIAGKVTTSTSELVLGESLTASIRLGPDGVASLAGDTVVVAPVCQPPPTTTTTTTQPPATTTTTTQPPATTTTTQPPENTTTTETPIGGVSAGGGGAGAQSSLTTGSVLSVTLLSAGGLIALLAALGVAVDGFRLSRR